MKIRYIVICLALAFGSGCKKDPAGPETPGSIPNSAKAVYVLNEGDFGDPAGARLTVLDVDKDSVYYDVFEGANSGAHLGNVGDDMKFHNGKAYFVLSGSSNLIVMNLANNVKEAEVFFPGSAVHDLLIDSVRNKIFVTRLFSNSVYVLNLATLAIIDSIAVGSNPLGMALANGRVFICNSGFGSDSTVTVADAGSHAVVATLLLSHGPSGAVLASDGRIWIACTGNQFSTPPTNGRVYLVDPATNVKVDSILFTENLFGGIAAGADGYVYILGVSPGSFSGGPVHRISVATRGVTMGFVPGTYYGLAFDDVAREIYVGDAKNFAGNGDVKIYTNAGALRKSFLAQKAPAVFGFKR